MKNGKNPTREQRKLIERHRLNSNDWLVTKDTPEILELVHRHSDRTTKTIFKEDAR